MSYDALPTAPQARIAQGATPGLGDRSARTRTTTFFPSQPADSGLTLPLASVLQAVRSAAAPRARDEKTKAIPTQPLLGLARNEGIAA
ncbi:MAG: hypothetical protein QUV10_04940 [Paracoccaceae bacterium]|jgi:hypothetical protein|nr:hypothetical protein [Paracoccaceae bacterium]MDM7968941.1 hypothetical protein [Paracoccaceae bacterium]